MEDLLKMNKGSFKLFNKLLDEYYIYHSKSKKVYNKIIEYKSENLIEPLTDKKECGFILPAISESRYTEDIYNFYCKKIEKALKFNHRGEDIPEDKIKGLQMIKDFTVDEIVSNETKEDKHFLGRRYDKGMRSLRLLRKIKDGLEIGHDSKIFGSLKLDPEKKKDIYLTIKPESFIKAGDVGDSCFSFGGQHQNYLLAYPTSPNILLAHTEDFSSRSWVFLDPESKTFSVSQGYPRENYYLQFVIYNFFIEKGYSAVPRSSFFSQYYQENTTLYNTLSKSRSYSPVREKKVFHRDLYTGKKIKKSDFLNIQGAVCEICEHIELGMETYKYGTCSYCEEGL